jgi:hypothetical protein
MSTPTKEEWMNDRQAFELALHRVLNEARRRGEKHTFGELLKMAKDELEQDYERNMAILASLPPDE